MVRDAHGHQGGDRVPARQSLPSRRRACWSTRRVGVRPVRPHPDRRAPPRAGDGRRGPPVHRPSCPPRSPLRPDGRVGPRDPGSTTCASSKPNATATSPPPVASSSTSSPYATISSRNPRRARHEHRPSPRPLGFTADRSAQTSPRPCSPPPAFTTKQSPASAGVSPKTSTATMITATKRSTPTRPHRPCRCRPRRAWRATPLVQVLQRSPGGPPCSELRWAREGNVHDGADTDGSQPEGTRHRSTLTPQPPQAPTNAEVARV